MDTKIVNDWGGYRLWTLSNNAGLQAKISNLGAIIQSLKVRSKSGEFTDVVLGYNKPSEYLRGNSFQGAIVGPYANRLKGARFHSDGASVQMEANEGRNQLHSASAGLHLRKWVCESVSDNHIELSCKVDRGEAGYPANLDIQAHYTLTEDNCLDLHLKAEADAYSPVNITQHSYFNLSGGKQSGLDHHLQINADQYWHVDYESIPIQKLDVANTAMDFRTARHIRTQALKLAQDYPGFDHCWITSGTGLRNIAELYSDYSGIKMIVISDQPGIQFYAGNNLEGESGKYEQTYFAHAGICLETQDFPNRPNMEDTGSSILIPGEVYTHHTIFKFL